MQIKIKERKQTKNGKIHLYLEVYYGSYVDDNGKRKYNRERTSLDLYLYDNPKSQEEKNHNKEVHKIASQIRAKTELDHHNGKYGFKSSFIKRTDFIEYFKKIVSTKNTSKNTYGSWDSTLKHLTAFAGSKISFSEIDQNKCEAFKDYLVNFKKNSGGSLASSTIASYFSKFRASLNQALKDGLINSNPASGVTCPRDQGKPIVYLELHELKELAKVDCRYDVLKRAFLFSCYTGLRWSDTQKLKWDNIHLLSDGGLKMSFSQKKTKENQWLYISPQAIKYMGQKQEGSIPVFKGLKYSSYMNVELTRWAMRAGISKHVTFHVSRHTFAVLQLEYGTDIYTLKELMGHKNLKNTEVYAKVVDTKKKVAANVIPSID